MLHLSLFLINTMSDRSRRKAGMELGYHSQDTQARIAFRASNAISSALLLASITTETSPNSSITALICLWTASRNLRELSAGFSPFKDLKHDVFGLILSTMHLILTFSALLKNLLLYVPTTGEDRAMAYAKFPGCQVSTIRTVLLERRKHLSRRNSICITFRSKSEVAFSPTVTPVRRNASATSVKKRNPESSRKLPKIVFPLEGRPTKATTVLRVRILYPCGCP